jgi:hypothetical protein
MHFVSYHAWKHPIFDWQPAYITRRLNVSITASTALRARCRGLAVIRCLINTRRPCSYPISIEWTALESARYSTKSITARSVSLSSMRNTIKFLHALHQICTATFKSLSILLGWAKTGLIPYNPKVILTRLRRQTAMVRPFTPPPTTTTAATTYSATNTLYTAQLVDNDKLGSQLYY